MKKLFEEKQVKRIQLEPCPFCGSEAEIGMELEKNSVMICCSCTICKAAATAYTFETYGKTSNKVFDEMEEIKERAIEAWNKRA